MGTRGTVHIYEDGKHLVSLYKQFDSYPTGLGVWLGKFLSSGELVNGIPGRLPSSGKARYFNGGGDLAAQLIAAMKLEAGDGAVKAGDVYVTTEGDSQEFNYRVYVPPVAWNASPRPILVGCEGSRSSLSLTPEEFLTWAEAGDSDEEADAPKPKRIRPAIPLPKEE